MQATDTLTNVQWQLADAIARQLVLDEADPNELRKIISYLRAYADREDAGKKFFDYLNTLACNGNRIGHSKQTQKYLQSIAATCQQHLSEYKDDVMTLLQVLGWSARLMQYYQTAPIGEFNNMGVEEFPSEAKQIRQEKIEKFLEAETLEEGKQLEANVLQKKEKGKKVKYEIAGVTYDEKEPKQFKKIPESGPVIVEIKSLKDDGSINHVKFVKLID